MRVGTSSVACARRDAVGWGMARRSGNISLTAQRTKQERGAVGNGSESTEGVDAGQRPQLPSLPHDCS
jgi:hypothetical protein